ncbi:polyprenyl synthetase family protein [Ferroacidibacillus organovorans]|uniref:polyprenyl synthetase family protein n=1 Tax=Ferroacidibacillus organovorans TaxID=1765683 RepID=UPI000AD3195C|nr:polyprenyl synthetase family protein [Ferroacidibacillus organovorans]
MNQSSNVAQLYQHLEGDLTRVEDRLKEALKCENKELQDAAMHLLSAGGKRLRPVFVLLAGTFGDYDFDRLSKVAVGLELIHMASLVHDDVIDDASTRRGTPTVKSLYGNRMSMYTGDFIFAQSLQVLTSIQDHRFHAILSSAIHRMTLGEIEQIKDLYNLDQTVRHYLHRIRRKTAFLIEMSCVLGAHATNAIPAHCNALRRFGYFAGMAFQITDDLLDLTSTKERLGKPVGSDLRQGNVTLPVLLALREKETGAELRNLITPDMSEQAVEHAVHLIKSSSGLSNAQKLADRYLVKASESLAMLPPTSARLSLAALATYIGKREH